ncbi:MFS transporter [Streptomyces sp. NPDC056983]|uniref:MFS transporter n=1 Tax=Streptomyces sp. NPDC056983 TaxID=3345987 RepID=UPI003626C78F
MRPRGALRLLIDRNFGGFFWGKLATTTATYLHSVVAAVVAFQATHSAVAVAIVTGVQFTPQLLLAPVAGAWADRGRIARQIIVGRLVCAAGSGSIVVCLLVADKLTGWGLIATLAAGSLVAGLGLVIGGPAMQSVTTLLVRKDELPTAIALNTAPMTVGRVAGPALGAILTQVAGPVQAFALAALGHLLFAASMRMVRVPRDRVSPPGSKESRTVAAALRHLRKDRPLMMLILVVTGLGFGSEPATTLAPVLAHELGGGTSAVGALTTSFGIGAGVGVVLSSWTARRVRHTVVVGAGLATLAAGLVGCAAAASLVWAIPATAAAGGGFVVASSSASTLIQLRAPDELRGRVMALWLMGFVGARPIASLVSGTCADLLSVRAAFLVVAGCLAVLTCVCRPRSLT